MLFNILVNKFLCFSTIHSRLQAGPGEISPPDKFEEVQRLFEHTVNAPVPGASIIVIKNGSILIKDGFGFADIEHRVPNTSETIFRLGSITKQFTALAILQLCEKRLLQIDDPIERYLSGVENRHQITIKHLLTHTSGMIESPDSQLAFMPGEQFSYSNAGYDLLGKMIENISGNSYQGYLQENIFNPLGMNHTGCEQPGKKIKGMAVGYKTGPDGTAQNIGETNASGAFAAGSIYSTVEDMYLWDQALYSETFISSQSLDQAFAQITLNDGRTAPYGFGWMVNQWNGLKEVSHGGDIAGFNTFISRFPTEKFSVIALSNVEMRPPGSLPNAEELSHHISDIYLSDKKTAEKENRTIQLNPEILQKYVGQYQLIDAPAEVIDAGGAIYTVIQNKDQLFVQSKLGEQIIIAETETRFHLNNNTIINFEEKEGRVTGMVIDLMGLGIRIVNATKLE